jgi:acetyltransferase-like isoleucine patch superfamily enzyme
MSTGGKTWMFGNAWRILRGYSARDLAVRAAEEYIWWIIRSWPGISGLYFRYWFLKATTKKLDGFCWITQGCTFVNTHHLSIGANFVAARNVQIDAIGGIEIGDRVGIGPNTVLLSHEHSIIGAADYASESSYRRRPIRIGRGVWIGANCFIKAGITLGDDAVVGACSNVVGDVPAGGRVIGSPAIPYVQAMRQLFAAQANTRPPQS